MAVPSHSHDHVYFTHWCNELFTTSLRTSRTVCACHEQFTTNSQAVLVHESFTTSKRQLQSRRCGPPGTIRWNKVEILFQTTPRHDVVPTYYGRWVDIYVSWTLLAILLHATHSHFFFLCIRFIWLPEHDSQANVGYIFKSRIFYLMKSMLHCIYPILLKFMYQTEQIFILRCKNHG